MFFHRYSLFALCAIALLIAHTSARAPSEDTPKDNQVSCVYPMSGQYGVLPRVLFYVSLIFAAFFGPYAEWPVIGALASAMTFSSTAAIHVFIIFANHGNHPPILDLDALGIFLIAMASISICPVWICFSSTLRNNQAGRAVVTFWFIIMIVAYVLASIIVNNTQGPPAGSNVEVACFLPDGSLLTSFAQLIGNKTLECVYDCFLTGRSIQKPRDAARVIWGAPAHGNLGYFSLLTCCIISGMTAAYGIAFLFIFWKKAFYEQITEAENGTVMLLRVKEGPGSQAYGAMAIGSAVWALLVVLIEISMRNIPVEENFTAIGQWGPWVAALFAIIGSLIYQFFQPRGSNEHRTSPEASLNETVNISPADDTPSGAGAQQVHGMVNLTGKGTNDYISASDDGFASTRSDDSYTPPSQIRYPEGAHKTPGRSTTSYNTDDEEADIGTHWIPLVERGPSNRRATSG